MKFATTLLYSTLLYKYNSIPQTCIWLVIFAMRIVYVEWVAITIVGAGHAHVFYRIYSI